MRPRIELSIIFALLMCFSHPAITHGAEPEPTAPAAADPNELIARLSDDDFDTRERATAALQAMGERAWPAVSAALQGAASERNVRLQHIAMAIAPLDEAQQRQANDLLKKLFDHNDFCRRNAGLLGLQALGYGGMRLLKAQLTGAGADVELSAKTNSPLVKAGEKFTLSAIARNKGSGTLWLNDYGNLNWNSRRYHSFVDGFGCSWGTRASRCRDKRGPLDDYIPLEPGGEMNASMKRCETIPGIYTYYTSISPVDKNKCVPAGLTGFDLNSAWKGKDIRVSVQVTVLPDLARHGDDDGTLRLFAMRMPERETGTFATAKCYEISLENTTARAVELPNQFARDGWYVWLDEQGNPCEHGGWDWPAKKDDDKRPETLSLAPGAKLAIQLQARNPAAPGRYSLLIGYNTFEPLRSDSDKNYHSELYLKIKNAAEVK